MNKDQLARIADAMVAPGKGLLAADESSSTIKKRFDAIGVTSTEENRRDYREFMFRCEDAMRDHISGVILYDETIRQKARGRHASRQAHRGHGVDPRHQGRRGRQADAVVSRRNDHRGARRPAGPHEVVPRDGRALRQVAGSSSPSTRTGARPAAPSAPTCRRWPATRRSARRRTIVPIVEPEVLMDGAHTIERNYEGHPLRPSTRSTTSFTTTACSWRARSSSPTW